MPERQYPSRLGSGALAVTAWLLTSASGRKSRRVEPCDRCPSRPRIWTDWPGRTRSMSSGKIGEVATVRDGAAITHMVSVRWMSPPLGFGDGQRNEEERR